MERVEWNGCATRRKSVWVAQQTDCIRVLMGFGCATVLGEIDLLHKSSRLNNIYLNFSSLFWGIIIVLSGNPTSFPNRLQKIRYSVRENTSFSGRSTCLLWKGCGWSRGLFPWLFPMLFPGAVPVAVPVAVPDAVSGSCSRGCSRCCSRGWFRGCMLFPFYPQLLYLVPFLLGHHKEGDPELLTASAQAPYCIGERSLAALVYN